LNTTMELSALNERIGQVFMIGIPGTDLDAGTEALIKEFNIGGIILFSRNIKDPVQVGRLCRDLQRVALSQYRTPLFLAVDQEGGRVARLKEPFTLFPGNEAIGEANQPDESAKKFARITAKEMRMVGLNMNMAPVVDVRWGEPDKHLSGRLFSKDPNVVGRLGRIVIKWLQQNKIMAVAKHFPGLGPAQIDPHFDLPKIETSKKDLENINFLPFREAIEEGVSAVMTSHAVYTKLDPGAPATLSYKVVTKLLREKLAYQGLIMTDDLEMGAIIKYCGVAKGAADAFQAGVDILLICENQNRVKEALKEMRNRILKQVIPFNRFLESYERIKKAKNEYLGQPAEIDLERIEKYFNRET